MKDYAAHDDEFKETCLTKMTGENDMTTEFEQQQRDSETIFTAISTSDFDNFKQAERAVVMLYVTDMSFSRGGISLALTKLEKFYAKGC